jgi:hypothetical protein
MILGMSKERQKVLSIVQLALRCRTRTVTVTCLKIRFYNPSFCDVCCIFNQMVYMA